jgi:hypothetical protein
MVIQNLNFGLHVTKGSLKPQCDKTYCVHSVSDLSHVIYLRAWTSHTLVAMTTIITGLWSLWIRAEAEEKVLTTENVLSVGQSLRLKKWLSIKHIIQHSTTILQHSEGSNNAWIRVRIKSHKMTPVKWPHLYLHTSTKKNKGSVESQIASQISNLF